MAKQTYTVDSLLNYFYQNYLDKQATHELDKNFERLWGLKFKGKEKQKVLNGSEIVQKINNLNPK
jgi:hypothetical protein